MRCRFGARSAHPLPHLYRFVSCGARKGQEGFRGLGRACGGERALQDQAANGAQPPPALLLLQRLPCNAAGHPLSTMRAAARFAAAGLVPHPTV